MKALGFSTSAVFLAVTTTAVTRLVASWGEEGGGEATWVLKYCMNLQGRFFIAYGNDRIIADK